ncbi:uncharacterized protein ASCRUDRAFT_5990 [Ascoidea rubescens DSM 1968]|uniref:Uncharacterized protein n=1 Tax=Ascoidea rubescens DSM 1968 TaxID=1344418 RepID=A0A1D2VRC5_9ASCO|nr:hypothetical protein ASCRUDRAFT_5990 [Ascoidea rubescens DSM 1968]ODV64117.1 hypothetical protein ASCRUDRAFT_5990 [Ascoidea rubescens DSM 1968]
MGHTLTTLYSFRCPQLVYLPDFFYEITFTSIIFVYSIVIWKSYSTTARTTTKRNNYFVPSRLSRFNSFISQLSSDQNVHYLLLAILINAADFVSYLQILYLLPFMVYSLFHVTSYTKDHILPILPYINDKSLNNLISTFDKLVVFFQLSQFNIVSNLEVIFLINLLVFTLLIYLNFLNSFNSFIPFPPPNLIKKTDNNSRIIYYLYISAIYCYFIKHNYNIKPSMKKVIKNYGFLETLINHL